MKVDRQLVYAKCNGHCGYCGRVITFKQMQVDHIRPKHYFSHGVQGHAEERFNVPDYDVNSLENLMPACARCNQWKSTFSVEQFRKEIELQVKRLNLYSSNYRLALDYGLIEEQPVVVRFYFERMQLI